MDPLLPVLDGGWTTLLVGLLFLAGVIGTVLPMFPGLSLIIVGAVVFALAHGLHGWTTVLFIAIVGLALIGEISNFVLPSRRANKAGASGWSIVLGVIGAIVGLFAIPFVGLPIGGALGIFLGEVIRGRSTDAAWDATKETLIGMGISFVVQFVIALWCLALWGIWALVA